MTMKQQHHRLDVTCVFIHSYLRQYIKERHYLTNVYKLTTIKTTQALMERTT